MTRTRHTLGSLFAALFRPFVDAWREEFGPRPAKGAPVPAVAEPAPVAAQKHVPCGWASLDIEVPPADLKANAITTGPTHRKPAKPSGRAKAAPGANRTTAKPKPRPKGKGAKRKPAKAK